MNEEVFKLLTSLIVKGRRITGPVSADRIFGDAAYAREVFRKVEEEGDEDLVMLSLRLRDHLGLLSPAGDGTHETSKDEAKPDGKYRFGARS